MLVSIIIPVYNGESFINRIYNSINNQTYKNYELIFFNDASKDNSYNILKKIAKSDKKVKVFTTSNNCGPGGAKNEGLKYAKGDYILFLDCDDYISENYLHNLVINAKENNYPDIVLSDFTKVNQNGKVCYVRNYKNKNKAFIQKISSVGKLLKKSYIDKYNLKLPYGQVLEDVLLHIGLVISNPTYSYTEENGYYYVFNENSISHTTLKKFKDGALDAGIKYIKELKNNQLLDIGKMDYWVFKYICWHLLKSGNNVGSVAMKKEYKKSFDFLTKYFPNYKKIKNLQLKNERLIIKIVLVIILLLNKIHLDKLFFIIYSKINLERFWPNL